MTDRPIIFSAPMVRALLEGRKSQTRRLLARARVFATPERPAFTLKGDDLARALQSAARFRRLDGDGWFWESDAFEWQAPAERTGWMAHIGYAPGDRLWTKHPADCFEVYWRPIPGWEGVYAAGTDGLIYRIDGADPSPLKGSLTSKGYLSVSLSRDGDWQTRSVHRLIAETFYGPPPVGAQVRYLNSDRTDNRPANIVWGTAEENWAEHSAAPARPFNIWQSSRYMPRWASRLTLIVTDVRVHRLQDITADDIYAEGTPGAWDAWGKHACLRACRDAWIELWDSLNGKRAPWDSNPWVVALSFDVVHANIDSLDTETREAAE